MSKQAIYDLFKAADIPFLLHFTRLSNLESIMRHGLCPVSKTAQIGVSPQINDPLRLDGHPDAVSLSIGFPNFRMFYKYRNGSGVPWVVLGINQSVLWSKDCAFCRHNAASSKITSRPLEELKTYEAFAGMFEEIEGIPSRSDQRLKSYDPTDGQAEVLVFDTIEPQWIMGVVFQNAGAAIACKDLLGTRQSVINYENRGFFASRSYCR
jgi:hypothetical protein